MTKEKIKAPAFDDIVFETRNKEYGAYKLRKKYSRNVVISLLIGIIIIGTAVITPYLNAKALENKQKRAERQVEIKMENLDQPNETVAPPPPPPPPPQETVQQAKYVPPVVVDSVKPEETVQLMTEPFIVVEEMPMFPDGGEAGLLKWIGEHTQYPEIAKENNIQGKVIVRFCVTAKGGVNQVSILKGVDPELDKEALRVVSILPPFKPGKQGGKPVPVWYMVPINFTLK
jgi:protein TonB